MRATLAAGIIAITASAQQGPIGFANYADLGLQGTTGGAGGKIVHVTNRADFEKYANAKEPYIIILDADLKGHYDYKANPKQKHDYVSVASNKTIIGGGAGARLDSLGLDINGQQNIIIRNLKISKADPDAIAFRNTHHVWVDHCDLSSQKEERDENDGLLDFTYGSSYLTVSWCKFHDHDKSSICSSGTRNITDYGRQRVTYHHNAFINCTQRNPRVGYGLGHIFNDYNDTNTSYAIGVFARVKVNVENCYFKNVKEAFSQMYSAEAGEEDTYWGFVKSVGNVFDATKNGVSGNSDGFDVSRYYDYDFALDEAANVPSLVDKMGCVEGLESDIIPFPGNGAIGVTRGTIVSCGDIEGAEGYVFEIGDAPDALLIADPEALDLRPATTYYWRATVTGGPYDGKTSALFRFTTASSEANLPTPEDGDDRASLREIKGETSPCVPVSLRWRDGFDATSYTVYMGTAEDLSEAKGVTVSGTAYQPSGLRHGETYYWRVDANNADGTVSKGSTWRFGSAVSYAASGRNEVEHAVRGALCFPERDVQANWILASNDSCNVGDQGPGYMSFTWKGDAGSYDLETAYFDESSGKGWFGLYINEDLKDQWTASANNNRMLTRKTEDVYMEPGDEIRIEFYTNGSMRCRTDYVDITPRSTGISYNTMDDSTTDHAAYTLQGQRVERLSRGVYIVNGQKKVFR